MRNQTSPQQSSYPNPGFGLYVHWPFCLSKCPYCDFNSHVRQSIDHKRWAKALLSELRHYADETGGKTLTSIFFGGGTPSLMSPDTVGEIIAEVGRHWALDPDLEITLEANPTSSESARFRAFAQAGVNRLSIGVQSLDDEALAFLGRQHTAQEALKAVALARAAFDRFSFDLIYARPEQNLSAWKDELTQALDLAPEHIALYQLTIEKGTAFHLAWQRGDLNNLPEDAALRLFEETRDILAKKGLPAYEISNHAQPGKACRHNLTYWRYGDYVGIGPGAHGRISRPAGKVATRQHRAPEAWLQSVEEQGHATRQRQALTTPERRDELVMMGLRLTEGISRDAFSREIGQDMNENLPGDRLTPLITAGFLEFDQNRLIATRTGRSVLDSVLSFLLR